MKNKDDWEPTKFIIDEKGKLVANERYINVTSLLITNKVAESYQEYIQMYAQGTILDLGCGTVPFFELYKNLVDEVICIDWQNSPHHNKHLDYTADLNQDIPIKTKSVDTVLLTDVLEHLTDPQNIMREIQRILRPHGKLILGVPFYYWLHEQPFDFHRYTRYQLKNLCNNNNLNIIELNEYGGPLSVIFDVIGKNIPKYLWPLLFQKIAYWFIKTGLGRKIDDRNKHNFPLGYCLVAEKIEE